eukprot:350771-Chlamydomonas_euryale.AAC.1
MPGPQHDGETGPIERGLSAHLPLPDCPLLAGGWKDGLSSEPLWPPTRPGRDVIRMSAAWSPRAVASRVRRSVRVARAAAARPGRRRL